MSMAELTDQYNGTEPEMTQDEIANHVWATALQVVTQRMAERMSTDAQLERLRKGFALVQARFVRQVGDHYEVNSASSDRVYLVNGTCECEDFKNGAPTGWCKHRLAALIYRRATAELTPPELHETDDTPIHSEHVAPYSETKAEIYVQVSGHRIKFIVSGADELDVARRVERLLQAY